MGATAKAQCPVCGGRNTWSGLGGNNTCVCGYEWSTADPVTAPTPEPTPEVYTPTTDDVRHGYCDWMGTQATWDERADQFDRWLAAHDAQVRAEALRQANAALADIDIDYIALVLPESFREGDIDEFTVDAMGLWMVDRADRIERGEIDV